MLDGILPLSPSTIPGRLSEEFTRALPEKDGCCGSLTGPEKRVYYTALVIFRKIANNS